ncbi:hypothetical protein LGK95_19115 [Clostridium algoriphilum]|uniref:hypothetical protein n=1 Tax=Clostridium algoriphilum TaxID=198347 RepID=UPI001CF53AD3|nr:hypothetical protein [Clostridium algoriphilum]MCB2295593.1 hypothetical protein [Clostridium algoriphilum]
MAKSNKIKKNKRLSKYKLIGLMSVLLGGLAIFASIILHNDGITLKKTSSTEVINKLKNIQVKGGPFELTQKNIDEVCNLYFKSPKSNGDMTINGVNIKMVKDKILIKALISYKNLNLVFSSGGKVNFSKGTITYVADNFKIGNLPLPKSLVVPSIVKLNNKILYAEDNSIKINSKVIPFKINNFKITNNKILGSATTLNMKKLFDDIDKKSEEEAKGKPVKGDEDLKRIRAEVERSRLAAQEKEKNTQDALVQAANKRLALTKVYDELKVAYSQVESSKEKQMLSIMISSVGRMKSNPSYNSSQDQATVKSIYGKLDSNSQERVKIVLFTNVDGDSIRELRQSFGL